MREIEAGTAVLIDTVTLRYAGGTADRPYEHGYMNDPVRGDATSEKVKRRGEVIQWAMYRAGRNETTRAGGDGCRNE